MRRIVFFLWLFLAFGFVVAQQNSVPYVVLVSFDGFRYDYVEHYNPPNFKFFIARGSRTEALIPSFPSKTFPNHYTIVTGLYPGNHGLVDNTFYDRDRDVFYRMNNAELVTDSYFYGGVPLWELAKRNQIKSASFFWPGSEMKAEARRPDYYRTYDDNYSNDSRVDQVIDWLMLPDAERPHFITLYFSLVDHAGHNFGPLSTQTREAVLKVDSLLGKLMKGIESTRLPVNVLLVSDHGMYELTVSEENSIFIDELVNRNDPSVKLTNGGTQAHLYVSDNNKIDSMFAILKKQEGSYTVIKKTEFPSRWHYQHDRVGDLIMQVRPGFYIREGSRERFLKSAKIGSKAGGHGYDPDATTDVNGIFYAQGPNIKSGIIIPPFQNIHIYPLIAKILGLPIPKIDGTPDVLDKIYRKK